MKRIEALLAVSIPGSQSFIKNFISLGPDSSEFVIFGWFASRVVYFASLVAALTDSLVSLHA